MIELEFTFKANGYESSGYVSARNMVEFTEQVIDIMARWNTEIPHEPRPTT